ncbi:MAG: MFS transporter [Actinomycetota bacterium]
MSSNHPLRSLKERNARVFFAGLGLSAIGTWAHNTAVVLLVRELGGGGLELGIAAACQFGPMLLFGLHAGAFADRSDRFRLTIRLQMALAVVAFGLGIIVLTDNATLSIVYGATVVFGGLTALENPTRRTFATELVPPENLGNILALNTSVMTGARIFGPALAALLAEVTSTAWVFLGNGISYAAVLVALLRMDQTRLHRLERARPSGSPVRDVLRELWGIPTLRITLIAFAVISTFAYNHSVSLPLLVSDRLQEDDAVFGWLLSAMSVGNVIGALTVARFDRTPNAWVFGAAGALALSLGALSFSTSLAIAIPLVIAFGFSATAFVNSSNNVVQERIDPTFRSRALALTSVLFIGSTPIGGPITGIIGDTAGAVWANLYGAIISAVAATVGWFVLRRVLATDGVGRGAVGHDGGSQRPVR